MTGGPRWKQIIEEEVSKILQAGVSSPIVIVKKKDGMIRFCIHYCNKKEYLSAPMHR